MDTNGLLFWIITAWNVFVVASWIAWFVNRRSKKNILDKSFRHARKQAERWKDESLQEKVKDGIIKDFRKR